MTDHTKLDRRPQAEDRRARVEATATPEPPVPRLRSRRQPVGMLINPEMEFLLARWQKQVAAVALHDRGAYARAFLGYLLSSGGMMTVAAHRARLDAQRADLAGDVQMLVRVERVKEGKIRLELSDGRKPIGAAEIIPGVLPAVPGETFLLTFSRPCCRECRRTDRAWVKPDLCSDCARQQRRKGRRRNDER